jgi:hypothetical protein
MVFWIYKRYLSKWWALLLAFWGIAFYDKFSMFGYLFHVLLNPSDVVNAASLSPLEITRTPFPSFSFFVFILCFYLSTLTYKLSQRRYILLTILWSLNIYVYMVNFLAGAIFWFGFIIFTRYISCKSFNIKSISKTVFLNIVVMCAVVSPLFIRMFLNTGLDREIIANLGVSHRDAGLIFGPWGVFFTYILPMILVIVVITVYCADYYELLYRFMPIIIMVITELIVLNLHIILGAFFQTRLFSIRIGNFFLLYLYFIPIIYFLSSPFKPLFHNTTKQKIAEGIHNFFKNYIIRYQIVISILGVTLTSLLVVSSSLRYYGNHKKFTEVRMKSVYDEFESMRSVSSEGGTLISEDIAVNLLLPVLSGNSSLMVNSFNNPVRIEDMLDRLVLYARIFNWDKSRFLDFMLPNEAYKDFYTKNDFIVSENILKNGFGYWLTWHLRKMDKDEMEKYKQDILYRFDNINIEETAKKYDLTIIQAIGEIAPSLPVKLLKIEKGFKLYLVGESK